MKNKVIILVIILVLIILALIMFKMFSGNNNTIQYSYLKHTYSEFNVSDEGIMVSSSGNIYSISSFQNDDITNINSLNDKIKDVEPVGKMESKDLKSLEKEVKKINDNPKTKTVNDPNNEVSSENYTFDQINYYDKEGSATELYSINSENTQRFKDAIDKKAVKDIFDKYYSK